MGVFDVPSYGAGDGFVLADLGLGRNCLMGVIDSFNELLLNSTQVHYVCFGEYRCGFINGRLLSSA